MSTIDTICSAEIQKVCSVGLVTATVQPRRHAMHRLWAAYQLWLEKREGRRVLRDLTNDQLRDIGLTRREATKEADKSFFWD